jgi:site-specific DNA-methyltransferase (adenine-specific)
MDTTSLLICGNSENLAEIVRSVIPPTSLRCVVTSPPYKEEDGFSPDLIEFIALGLNDLEYKGPTWINFGDVASEPFRPFRVATLYDMYSTYNKLIQTIIWVKNHRHPRQGHRTFDCTHEYVFYFSDPSNPSIIDRTGQYVGVPYKDKSNVGRYAEVDIHCPGTVWYIPYDTVQSSNQKNHPYEFPVDLPLRCIDASFPKDEIGYVLDPFVGSGTTLVACQRMGIRGIGIDTDYNCIKIARQRLGGDVEVINLEGD